MKKFLRVLYQPWVSLYEMIVRDLPMIKKTVSYVLGPIFFFYLILYILMFLYSFAFWVMPVHIPIPFVGDLTVDRILLLGGLMLLILVNSTDK